eukprot:Tbor_TRINITY_DN3872_c0_g1::TRINITY_DN3872_c0_g1_i1::g.5657::m.5657/K18272/RP2; protein XRP2
MKDQVIITEELIREKLENTGQINKMRAMVIDASIRAISADEVTAKEMFVSNANFRNMQTKEPENLLKALSIAVECLNYLGLTYSANVVAVEAGMKPVTFLKRNELAKSLGISEHAKGPLVCLLESAGATVSLGASKPSSSLDSSTPAINTTIIKHEDVHTKPHPLSEDSTYIISHWNNREFVRHNQVADQQVNIDYLNDCKVFILDPLDSTNVDDCNRTDMVFAAAKGSIFLRNCHNCVVTAACKQLRTRDCSNIELRLFSGTDPVVESSHNITFKPFNLKLPGLISAFKAAHLNPAMNRYIHVYDFTADDPKIPQPHFTVSHMNHGLKMEKACLEYGTPEAPKEIEMLLNHEIEPAETCEAGGSKSHNIKTGAAAWTGDSSGSVLDLPGITTGKPPVPSSSRAAPPVANDDASSYSSYNDDDDYASSNSDKYNVDEDSDNF